MFYFSKRISVPVYWYDKEDDRHYDHSDNVWSGWIPTKLKKISVYLSKDRYTRLDLLEFSHLEIFELLDKTENLCNVPLVRENVQIINYPSTFSHIPSYYFEDENGGSIRINKKPSFVDTSAFSGGTFSSIELGEECEIASTLKLSNVKVEGNFILLADVRFLEIENCSFGSDVVLPNKLSKISIKNTSFAKEIVIPESVEEIALSEVDLNLIKNNSHCEQLFLKDCRNFNESFFNNEIKTIKLINNSKNPVNLCSLPSSLRKVYISGFSFNQDLFNNFNDLIDLSLALTDIQSFMLDVNGILRLSITQVKEPIVPLEIIDLGHIFSIEHLTISGNKYLKKLIPPIRCREFSCYANSSLEEIVLPVKVEKKIDVENNAKKYTLVYPVGFTSMEYPVRKRFDYSPDIGPSIYAFKDLRINLFSNEKPHSIEADRTPKDLRAFVIYNISDESLEKDRQRCPYKLTGSRKIEFISKSIKSLCNERYFGTNSICFRYPFDDSSDGRFGKIGIEIKSNNGAKRLYKLTIINKYNGNCLFDYVLSKEPVDHFETYISYNHRDFLATGYFNFEVTLEEFVMEEQVIIEKSKITKGFIFKKEVEIENKKIVQNRKTIYKETKQVVFTI